jgi:formylmethanofuran dehydrogenase subunit E
MTERCKCPNCGIPTIPNKSGLTESEMLCDSCAEKAEMGMEKATERQPKKQ